MTDALLVAKKMGEAYASFESYQDSGHIETRFHFGSADEYTTELSFTTKFRRPNLFFFESWESSQESAPHRIIWSDGEGTYCNHFGAQMRRVTDLLPPDFCDGNELSMALAGALEAHVVAVMLMPELPGRRLCDFSGWELQEEADVNGEHCYCVNSKTSGDDVESIWISKEWQVLLKIDDRHLVKSGTARGEFRVHCVTSYTDIRLNAEIPIEDFNLSRHYPVTEGAIEFGGGAMIIEERR